MFDGLYLYTLWSVRCKPDAWTDLVAALHLDAGLVVEMNVDNILGGVKNATVLSQVSRLMMKFYASR